MERAVAKVRQRLLKVTAALEAANIPYAVVGGNAVMAWVEQVDEAAVRFTQDVDLAIRREDFDRVKQVLEAVGFVYRHVRSIDMFLDGPDTKARDAVHILFAGEKVRASDAAPVPDVTNFTSFKSYRVINLESLVRMKLTSYRDKDRTHLRDMIGVGLIDETWPAKLPPELGQRLQALLDDPNG
jgi:hypothetical protein